MSKVNTEGLFTFEIVFDRNHIALSWIYFHCSWTYSQTILCLLLFSASPGNSYQFQTVTNITYPSPSLFYFILLYSSLFKQHKGKWTVISEWSHSVYLTYLTSHFLYVENLKCLNVMLTTICESKNIITSKSVILFITKFT